MSIARDIVQIFTIWPLVVEIGIRPSELKHALNLWSPLDEETIQDISMTKVIFPRDV